MLHAVVDQVQQNQGENLKCIAVTVQQQYQNAAVWSPSEVYSQSKQRHLQTL